MKSNYLIIPVIILILTSACVPYGSALVDEKVALIQQDTKYPTNPVNKEEYKFKVNKEDEKFKALQPYGPNDAFDISVNYQMPLNPQYMEMAVAYKMDAGTNISPYIRYSLFEKKDNGIYDIVAVCDIEDIINRGGIDRLQSWNSVIYREQVKQAENAITNKINAEIKTDKSQLVGSTGYGVVKKISDSELSIRLQFRVEWENGKKSKRLNYEALMEKNSKSEWFIESIKQIM